MTMNTPQEIKRSCQHNRDVNTYFRGNVYCVVRNHMQDPETKETLDKRWFSLGHGTILTPSALSKKNLNKCCSVLFKSGIHYVRKELL